MLAKVEWRPWVNANRSSARRAPRGTPKLVWSCEIQATCAAWRGTSARVGLRAVRTRGSAPASGASGLCMIELTWCRRSTIRPRPNDIWCAPRIFAGAFIAGSRRGPRGYAPGLAPGVSAAGGGAFFPARRSAKDAWPVLPGRAGPQRSLSVDGDGAVHGGAGEAEPAGGAGRVGRTSFKLNT